MGIASTLTLAAARIVENVHTLAMLYLLGPGFFPLTVKRRGPRSARLRGPGGVTFSGRPAALPRRSERHGKKGRLLKRPIKGLVATLQEQLFPGSALDLGIDLPSD